MSDPKESGKPEPAQADAQALADEMAGDLLSFYGHAGQDASFPLQRAWVAKKIQDLLDTTLAAEKKRADEAESALALRDATDSQWRESIHQALREAEERERQLQARVEELTSKRLDAHKALSNAGIRSHYFIGEGPTPETGSECSVVERIRLLAEERDKLKALVGQLVEACGYLMYVKTGSWADGWTMKCTGHQMNFVEAALAAAREAGQAK